MEQLLTALNNVQSLTSLKSMASTRKIMLCLTLSGILFVFLPAIRMQHLYTAGLSSDQTTLYITIKTNEVENALLVSLSVCLPSINSGLIIDFFPGILFGQSLLYWFGILAALNSLNPAVWTNRLVCFLLLLAISASVVQVWSGYTVNNKGMVLIVYILFGIASIIVLYKIFTWFKPYVMNCSKSMDIDEYSSAIQMLEGAILILGGKFFSSIIFGLFDWFDTPTYAFITRIYFDTAALICYTVFNDCLLKREFLFAQRLDIVNDLKTSCDVTL
eukprot:gene12531-26398_t